MAKASNNKDITMKWKPRPALGYGGSRGLDFTHNDVVGWSRISYDPKNRQLIVSSNEGHWYVDLKEIMDSLAIQIIEINES